MCVCVQPLEKWMESAGDRGWSSRGKFALIAAKQGDNKNTQVKEVERRGLASPLSLNVHYLYDYSALGVA